MSKIAGSASATGATLLLLVICRALWLLHYGRSLKSVSTVFLDWDACIEALPHFEASPWGCVCGLPRHEPTNRWDLRSGGSMLPASVRIVESEEHGPSIAARRSFRKEDVVATHDALLVSPPPAGRAWNIPIRFSDAERGISSDRARDVDLHPGQYGFTIDCGDGKAQQHLFEGYMDLVPHIAVGEVKTDLFGLSTFASPFNMLTPVAACWQAPSLSVCDEVFEVDLASGKVLRYLIKMCAARDIRAGDLLKVGSYTSSSASFRIKIVCLPQLLAHLLSPTLPLAHLRRPI